jgi:PKHD-type hydroxylase
MSIFILAPPPSSIEQPPFCTWRQLFSPEQLDEIVRIGKSRPISEATIGGGEIDGGMRQSSTSWIPHNQESAFIYDAFGWCARQLNGKYYDLDLFGFVEDIQFTIYDGDGAHYDWHVDKGASSPSPRKLSLAMQLSDPSEYEGGDLEVWTGGSRPDVVDRERGIVACFPAYTLHRVTPVTTGVRMSLVAWLAGPRFR